MRTYFEEKQRFDQWWLRMIIVANTIGIVGLVLYAVHKQLILGEPWGDRPMSDTGLVLFSVGMVSFMVAMLYMFFNIELEIVVDKSSLSYRYFPILSSWRHLDKDSIKSFEAESWIMKGHGHRVSLSGKRTIIVKGHTGVNIDMMDGKKLLLSTQNPSEFIAALKRMKKGNQESVY